MCEKFLRKSLFLFIFIFALKSVFAEQLPLKVYSSADGLASSVIHHIARDSQGFLWFCARGGLSRFDGSEFTSYQIGDETSPIVQFFLETSDGTYWVATDKGLYRVTSKKNVNVQPLENPPKSGFRSLNAQKVADAGLFALHEDRTGRFWAAGNTGLFLIENRNDERVSLQPTEFSPTAKKENRESVRRFAESADGSLWLAAYSGAVRLLPDGRWVEYPLPRISQYEQIYSLRLDANGRVWVSHSTGLYIFQPEPLTAFGGEEKQIIRSLPIEEREAGIVGAIKMPTAPDRMIRLKFKQEDQSNKAGRTVDSGIQDLYPTDDGKMWIPSAKSLYVFEGENYLRLQDTNSLPGRSSQIIEDLQGNLWFGTFGGVTKFVRNGLITYNQAGGLTEPLVHSIQETPDGNLLVVHGTWLVSVLTAEEIKTVRVNLPENYRFIWTANPVFQDKTGAIWSLSDKGLYRFSAFDSLADLAKQTPQNITNPILKEEFWYRVFPDSQGNIWFATRNTPEKNYLYKYNLQTGEWSDFTSVEGFPKGKPVASFAEDKAGNLWFGFYGADGIVKFSDGRFTQINTADGLPKGAALDLQIDGKGRLWIASVESGVSRLENPSAEKLEFFRYTENEGLSNNNVRCLAEDAEGNIYAGTVRGVSRIDPETNRIKNITTADGLAADFVHSAFRDKNGAIWFGTANGLSKLEPKKEIPPPAPPIFISDLQIAGANYSVSEFGQTEIGGIETSASENNLQINFFSIGEKDSLRYQYKLEGTQQEDWRNLGEQRSVNFGNLSSGAYRLLVRAVNDAGVASENPAVVSFKINPPFWRTWWFMALAFLFVGGAVFALDRYRVSKTRQVESALTQSRESENRFRTLAETASDAILTIDEESRIIFVNQAIEKVFGYTADELIGRKLTVLMPERMRGGPDSGLDRFLKTKQKNINWSGVALPGLHKNGYEIPLEVSFGEFERDGKTYFTGIARDISERKRAEAELQKAREEKFRELERVRTRIATDLHDDIGSSLTQIAVLTEVARGQANYLQAENLSTPLERIKNVSKELVAVMSDVVWAINPQKDFLHDLVQRMRRFASDVFTTRGVKFEFAVPEIEGNLALGANIRREVFAIFKESVNNAVKYSECTAARAEFRIEENHLILQISDNGKGFDAKSVLSAAFNPEMGGNGLVNMRRRAEDLGGKCEIESEIGKGTTINLIVPLNFSQNGLEK